MKPVQHFVQSNSFMMSRSAHHLPHYTSGFKNVLCVCLFLAFYYVAGAQSVGIGTPSPHASAILHTDLGTSASKGILVTGVYDGTNGSVPDLGLGSRLMFYPGKGAFRAGALTQPVSADYWNNAQVGLLSIGLGANNKASGFASVAVGLNAQANGDYSQAYGINAEANGNSATAFNSGTANGGGSFAAGAGNFANGRRSFVVGSDNVAKGYATTVVGLYNDSILTTDQTAVQSTTPLFMVGNGSSQLRSNAMVVLKNGSIGMGTNAPHQNAILHVSSESNFSKGFLVSGENDLSAVVPTLGVGPRMMFYPGKIAFRVGYVSGTQWDNLNVGRSSVAMGTNTIASASNSFSIGYQSVASAESAIALGYSNEASGQISTTIGAFNNAAGEISTAIGRSLLVNGFSSTVVGLYNEAILLSPQTSVSSSTPLFIVGNGDAGARSNAMVVLKNGNVGIGTNTPANNLVVNSSSPEIELQAAGVQKGFVQLSGDNIRVGCYGSNPTGSFIVRLNGGERFTVLPNGNATLGGTLTQNSDERLKENIIPIEGALEKLMQVNGYEYNWKPELQRDNSAQIGLLAQNVEKVLPQLVSTDKEGIKSVAYQNMVPVLIEAIKDLQKQVAELKEKLGEKD